ncbi:MAG: hypothetical protein ABIO72_02040 [Patescibacteria group bacterium]
MAREHNVPYRFMIPPEVQPDFRQLDRAIRDGQILSSFPQIVRLGRLGDGGKRRPEVVMLNCELDMGPHRLMAHFWPDPPGGIPQEYSTCSPHSHNGRHFAAFVTSHVMRIHACPISAPRTHLKMGPGMMIGMVAGRSCMLVDHRREDKPTQVLSHINQSPSFAENLLFNAIIGSGQRLESSLVSYKATVWSQYHPEAFTYTESARLEHAFAATPRVVSQEFWTMLRTFSDSDLAQAKIHGLLKDFYGVKVVRQFTDQIDRILSKKQFNDEDIRIL